MRKAFLLSITLLLAIFSWAQDVVVNKPTASHANIAGTRVSLIWPNGFTKAPNFQGLQDETGAIIMVIEGPTSFASTASGLTKEGLESQGLVVYATEKLTLNNMPALLITAEQKAFGSTYSKYILAFGDERESTIINGAFLKDTPELGSGIRASLLSALVEKDRVVNPLDVVDFKVKTEDNKLKVISKVLANTLVYTVDGNLPTLAKDKTTFLVGKSISESEIKDKQGFAVQRIKKLSLGVSDIKSITPIQLDGLEGYEVIGAGKNPATGAVLQVYEVILFSDSLYYIMVGHSEDKHEKNLELFRQVTGTFKRK